MSQETKVQITPEQEREFREIFNLVDRDGGGSITRAELQDLMATLQISAGAVLRVILASVPS